MPAAALPVAQIPDRTSAPSPSGAIRLLQIQVCLLVVIPPHFRFGPLGFYGNPALMFAIGLFGLWSITVLTPSLSTQHRCPHVRIVLMVFWAAILITWGVMHRSVPPVDIVSNGDRFVVEMIAFTGLALFAAEAVRTMDELMIVVRTFVAVVAIMSLVAIMQGRLHFNVVPYLAKVPLLSAYHDPTALSIRGGLGRPAGTASHPIEFGVVVGLGLAFAIHLALYDRAWPRTLRNAALALIALGIPVAVSRSAVIVGVAVLITFLVGSTNAVRARAFPVLAAFLAVVFVGFPGLLGTLTDFFGAGSSDSSIATRISDFDFVQSVVATSPWVGLGPGSLLPRIRILDNQYLLTLVEMGFLGLAALIILFGATAWLGRGGRKRFSAEGDRFLGQMFAGAGYGIVIAAVTFDAFSFQMFTLVVALLIGLSGRYWSLGREEERRRESMVPQELGAPDVAVAGLRSSLELRECRRPPGVIRVTPALGPGKQ